MKSRLVGVLLVALVTAGDRAGSPAFTAESRLAALSARWKTRPVESRIGSMVRYLPRDSAASAASFLSDPSHVVQLLDEANSDTGRVAAVRAAAIVQLVAGDAEPAARRVSAALERQPGNRIRAALWSDLSAIRYAQATSGHDAAPQLLVQAADHALNAITLDQANSDARFNLALSLQQLGLRAAARTAWQAARAFERDEAWRREISLRLAGVEQESAREGWRRGRERLNDTSTELAPADATAIVRTFRQPSRELVDEILLPAWGGAVLAADDAAAARYWSRVQSVAIALSAVQDDPFLTAVIRHPAAHHADVARAFREFGRGRQLYEATQRELALAALLEASRLFQAMAHPFQLRSDVNVAMALYQMGRYDEAERYAARVRDASSRGRYRSVEAAAAWLLGICQTQRGATDDALRSYEHAAALFRDLEEHEDHAAVESSAAHALRITGDHARGWQRLMSAVQRLENVHTARRRHTILLNASLFAADANLYYAAIEFQQWSLEAARERGTANSIVEGLVRRARLRLLVGQHAEARVDLDAARATAQGIESDAVRQYVEGWIAIVTGESLMRAQPAAAVPYFRRARELFERTEPAEVPAAHLATSRALAAADQVAAAEDEIARGIAVFERRRAQLQGDALRVSYQDLGWSLFDRLIEHRLLHGHDTSGVFEVSEQARALWLARAQDKRSRAAIAPAEVARQLPPDTAVIHYTSLDRRLLVWLLSDKGAQLRIESIARAELDRMVASYRDAIARETVDRRAQGIALHRLLLGPALSALPHRTLLAIVPDGALHRLPFAALIDGATGRYLAEDFALTVVPSADVFLRAPREATSSPSRVVLVGNDYAAGLPRLPAVRQEIESIAAEYTKPVVLQGADATFDNTLRHLYGTSMLHFAGHARANSDFPWQSRLFFAPSPRYPSGVVTADAIAGADLSTLRLVVLSACETADGPVMRGTGVISLASTLLMHGVPAVVASMWPIEDDAARAILAQFHREYARNGHAVDALGQTQRVLLASSDPRLREPKRWASFIVTAGAPVP